MKMPPILSAPQGSTADQATQDLLAACEPLGRYIATLPAIPERAAALQHFNECLLWASQAILRSTDAGKIFIARAGALPS